MPFTSPGNLPDPGIIPGSLALQAEALLSEPPGKPQQGGREEIGRRGGKMTRGRSREGGGQGKEKQLC